MQDKIFRALLIISAIIIPVIGVGIVFSLVNDASGAFKEFGFWNFIFSDDWVTTAGKEKYGALPFITGTLLTTLLALLMCIPFSLPVALFTGEYFKGKKIATILSTVVDLLAGIPSIIYGLWGFYALRSVFMHLNLSPQGSGILTAAFVLAIMIVPYAASLSAEFIKMVPSDLKEGAYAMGATRAEVIRRVVFPMAGSGIFSAYILAIGRALGETMTVTMLIGNTNQMPETLRTTGNTMASIIANQFGEADGLKLSSLIAIGLLLFLITAIINMIGKILIRRAQHV
ncbi:Phosphate transport system permease protein pstC [uncultured Bacteroides sp.]|uniref:Phosphate transport system permease protein n=1 Tax=Candidatus Phocaeicola faecigallinarum TaxID=2838732 RepID=A0A948X040_9BACT|nr:MULTISPECIES: phosphate ABC transporter permease subunit PstC [Bacteroides]MBU3839068.1 phosphate ABC transporter permease subunit PstC [Candidatus Phocaeicola faecigallinarum]MBM6883773.1 phosphate ABC transporter permease subunit PstC [Bacteroides caecigallinarum]MCF2737387.1 phosphate ABC transporter permease subunit PstC [Bacteroides caecigallinarum]MCR8894713.1 phosphate ABC transporter permease subunit PstC [Bacteroides sp. ET336]MCU6772832.1 phosphate ABC transporter permease subunit